MRSNDKLVNEFIEVYRNFENIAAETVKWSAPA